MQFASTLDFPGGEMLHFAPALDFPVRGLKMHFSTLDFPGGEILSDCVGVGFSGGWFESAVCVGVGFSR